MPYLTAAQIELAMVALAARPGGLCTRIPLLNPTVSEGIGPTTYSYIKIANGAGPGRTTILATAGMHAREWAQSDAVLSFADKLLTAYAASAPFVIPAYTDKTGSTFGPFSVEAITVRQMVDKLNILILPLANPDGRAFCQSNIANFQWRKNRTPRIFAADPATVGVDLNRNFDIAWDFDIYYNPAGAASASLHTSKDPRKDTFIGQSVMSQAEVRNIKWILDNNSVTYFVDLHSYGPNVLYPWGIERNGSNMAQTFRDAAFDHQRDGDTGNAYSEYFPNNAPARLLDQHDAIAKKIRDAIRKATGRPYVTGNTTDTFYVSTGGVDDYVFSRQFPIIPGSPTIRSFTVEFGELADTFQPSPSDPHGYPKIEREVHAALLSYLQSALPPPPAAPPPAAQPTGGGCSKCFFSMAAADLAAGAAWLDTLRRGRAALLGGRRTRGAMLALDRLYRRLGSSLFPHVAGRRWAKRAIAYGLVAPAAGLTALAFRWSRR